LRHGYAGLPTINQAEIIAAEKPGNLSAALFTTCQSCAFFIPIGPLPKAS
ncbi:hypothetical protein Bbelb_162490, partial [Branchiostoma belcheri]